MKGLKKMPIDRQNRAFAMAPPVGHKGRNYISLFVDNSHMASEKHKIAWSGVFFG
jgi:hypothetical protein